MTRTDIVKLSTLGAQVVSTIGIGKIAGGIILRNAPLRSSLEKLCVATGGIVATALVMEHTNVYLGQKIEQFSEWLSGNKDK